MPNKFRIWVVAAMMAFATPVVADSDTTLTKVPVAVLDPGWNTDAEQSVLDAPCKGDDCLAAQDLSQAYDVLEKRSFPNTMARLGGYASYLHDLKGYNRVLNALPPKHPGRIPVYCALLARIAANDPDHYGGVHLNTEWVVELAARLDEKDAYCIPGVVHGLPHTESMDELIADERERCYREYPYHHCADIRRPPSMSSAGPGR